MLNGAVIIQVRASTRANAARASPKRFEEQHVVVPQCGSVGSEEEHIRRPPVVLGGNDMHRRGRGPPHV